MFTYAITVFRRQIQRYWHIICILTFSMIIPLMFNILGSSIGYGKVQETQSIKNNSDFFVASAPYSLMTEFDEIHIFSTTYQDGNLYLKILDSGFDVDDAFMYSKTIHDVLDSTGLSHLQVYNMTKMKDVDTNTQNFMYQINLITVVITLITVLIFQAGYRSHTHYFRDEIETLYTLGISSKNIVAFFLWSLTLEFFVSYSIAIAVAYSSMKFLLSYYLEVQSAGYSWLLFYVDWKSVGLLGCVWYGLLAIICLFQIRSLMSKPTVSNSTHLMRMQKSLNSFGLEKLPYEILWRRCCGLVKHGIVLSISVCSIAVFMLNYASINAETIKTSSDAAFSVSKNVILNGTVVGFSNEELSQIGSIEGIEISYKKNVSPLRFLVAQPINVAYYPVFVQNDIAYASTHIKVLENAPPIDDSYSTYIPVWINPYQPGMSYHPGDLIDLYVNNPSVYMVQHTNTLVPGLPSLVRKLQLQVVGYVDTEYLDGPLELYFDENMYDSLTEDMNPSFVEIRLLDQDGDPRPIEMQLRGIVNNKTGYELINLIEQNEISLRMSKGLYLLITILVVCFLILTVLVVAILLKEFIQQQQHTNYLFMLVGVPAHHLQRAYRRISFVSFLITAVISMLIGALATSILFANTGYTFSLTVANAAIYATILCCLYMTMTIPMHSELRKQFARIE